MKKQRFTVLLTIICLLMTMTCSVNVYAADTIEDVTGVKLVQPSSSTHAIPDRYYDIENPLNGKTNRDCSISAETLWTLAERTYAAGETEFYINTAFSDKEIDDIDIEIETGMYPLSNEGTLCSMGILTADGYLHIGAQAALTLLNDSLYSKISIDTKLQRAGQYRITMTGIKLDGSSEEFFS